jgi:hypothetical protein
MSPEKIYDFPEKIPSDFQQDVARAGFADMLFDDARVC